MHHGRGEQCQGTRVFHDGHGQVLDLGIVVGRVGEHAGHALRQSHHPAEHVNMVHGMVQCASAAFLFPGSAPPQVIVAVSAPPEGIDLCGAHRPGNPAVQKRLEVPDRLAEAVLGNDGQLHPAFISCPDHGIALFQRGCHGLFADGILAGAQCIDGDLSMHIRRSAAVNQCNITATQDLVMVQIAVAVQTVLCPDFFCLARDDVHERGDPYTFGKLQVCMDMRMRDIPGTDNGNLNHGIPSCHRA